MRRKEKNTVSFSLAVERCLEMKKNRSERTLRDIRQTMSKLMACDGELASTPLRSICTVDCARILNLAYAHSPSRFIKARANLSGVFSVAHKLGWCGDNPVKAVFIPALKEKEIKPLTLAEIKRLFAAARLPEHQDCIPALALMLYAGVRPDEVRRLHWADIDWEENVLYMAVRHTKTGGGRHVPLCSYLVQLLRAHKNVPQRRICPPRWAQRWRFLRQAAGFTHWVADSLRHSYASYHAKHYRDLPRLQLAMGHRDVQLLLTRYVNLRGITKATAQCFWQGAFLENQ